MGEPVSPCEREAEDLCASAWRWLCSLSWRKVETGFPSSTLPSRESCGVGLDRGLGEGVGFEQLAWWYRCVVCALDSFGEEVMSDEEELALCDMTREWPVLVEDREAVRG